MEEIGIEGNLKAGLGTMHFQGRHRRVFTHIRTSLKDTKATVTVAKCHLRPLDNEVWALEAAVESTWGGGY